MRAQARGKVAKYEFSNTPSIFKPSGRDSIPAWNSCSPSTSETSALDTREGVPLVAQERQQHNHKKEMGVASGWELHHATMPLPQMIIWRGCSRSHLTGNGPRDQGPVNENIGPLCPHGPLGPTSLLVVLTQIASPSLSSPPCLPHCPTT